MAMFCTNCGFEFEGNFCPNCGARAWRAGEAAAQPAPTAVREAEGAQAPCRPDAPEPPQGYPNGLTEEDLEKICKHARKNEDFFGCYLMINYDIPRGQAAHIARSYLESKKDEKPTSIFFDMAPGSWPARQGKTWRYPNWYDRGIYLGEDPQELGKRFKKEMWETRVAENEANGVFGCPECGSTNVLCEGRDFSVGAAAAGGILMGDVGMMAGVGSGKNLNFTCLECGKSWKFRTR